MSTGNDRSGALDLLVRNGTLVIPGVGQMKADVGIAGGKIVALGANLTQPAAETYDATGRTVLPGIFDPHTHIGNELSYETEAETETRAAILGGVTTIGIFLRSLEDSYFDHLPAFRQAMDERSYVERSVLFPDVRVGPNCLIKRAIIDTGGVVPEGTQIGVNPEEDARRFYMSEKGVALVTRDMLSRLRR